MPARDPARIKEALWGLFVADALAMPAHWFYDTAKLREAFGEKGIQGFQPPCHPHPEAFMGNIEYTPDLESAKKLGRNVDIVNNHYRFYKTNLSAQDGVDTTSSAEGCHYHHGLAAGQNTLQANLVRVLIRSVASRGKYDEEGFIQDYVEFLTTPGSNSDPYTEGSIRKWFVAYSKGAEPTKCAPSQRNGAGTNAMGGVIRPLVLSLLADDAWQGLAVAAEHQQLTHATHAVTVGLSAVVPLLQDLVRGTAEVSASWSAAASRVRPTKTSGAEMFSIFAAANFKLPPEESWRLQNELGDTPLNLEELAKAPVEEIAGKKFATVCNIEHSLPLLFYSAASNKFDFKASVLADINAGGDNVHRGMVLGALLGASGSVPQELKDGLVDKDAIAKEIDAFVAVATSGKIVF